MQEKKMTKSTKLIRCRSSLNSIIFL